MAKIFIIVGNTGAGKSTYSQDLGSKEDAYIFTGDEWFKTLFVPDTPTTTSYEWALERTERIEKQILKEALKLVTKNIDVILDLGFFTKVQRQRIHKYFRNHSIDVIVHYLDINKELRWQRVSKRNFEKKDNYQFDVSREIFEFCETIFEPMSDDEKSDVIISE